MDRAGIGLVSCCIVHPWHTHWSPNLGARVCPLPNCLASSYLPDILTWQTHPLVNSNQGTHSSLHTNPSHL